MDRRAVLAALAGGGAASLAGCSSFVGGGNDGNDGSGNDTAAEVAEDEARDLAERFAPTLYFDEAERWFPTDPRPYEVDRDGATGVDGFEALDGYAERARESDTPPDSTVFYHAVRYEDSPLAVVQFWCYSAVDQFTTNFHWHDWEVLHVFVDTEADEPVLYVASSHSRKVPNNEFLDPEPGTVPRVLSELRSHSSALSVNDAPDRFQRLPTEKTVADITNRAIEALGDLASIPAAYGLPRDEGGRLPYLVPELDGAPVYEHERLPSVERSDLVDEALTVRSFDALSSPPTDLPGRATGLVFGPEDREDDVDVTYELLPTSELEHVAAFTGPQLSFEFAVPGFVEDAVASHITTTSVPWEQPRYADPAADVSDPTHRAALADRYDAIDGPGAAAVVAAVAEAVESDDAPDGKGLATVPPTVEAVTLLESEPAAVPTVGGVEGEVPPVARENAAKLEVDTEGTDADVAEETRAEVAAAADDGDDDGGDDSEDSGESIDPPESAVRGLSRALAAVAEAARRAAERAETGDRAGADERLEAVATRLDRVATRLEEARGGLPGGLSRATDRRLEQARRRVGQARNADTLR
ncbi:MAG: hypothetical protein V5A62_01420 [Haloarculaceae archaeon]